MTKPAKSSPATPSAPAAALNQAKAAFDQYRRKKVPGPAPQGNAAAAAPAPPPGYPLPPWGVTPPPGAAGPPPGPPWPASPSPSPVAMEGPFFESVGQMLRLGVAFATAAFAGGLQVMQGFTGPAMGGGCGAPTPPGGCAGGWPEPARGCGCGCEPSGCGGGPPCRPGVHNCDCCG
jgi:hypothetical protein